MRLGTIAANGSTYFTSTDINEARAFLRDHGLECLHTGWASQDGQKHGAIYFDSTVQKPADTWTAGYWNEAPRT